MRKNFGAKPWLYPQPVFIIASYGEDGTPDAINAAWGGLSESNEISMCLSPGHKTVKNILKRGAFTVSMATAAYVAACDYVGLVSGNDVPDKLEKAGFQEPITYEPVHHTYIKLGEKVGNAFQDGKKLK